MEFLPKESYKKILYIAFYTVIGVFSFHVFFKYAFPVILPFLFSFIIAYTVQRPSAFIAERFGISKKFCSLFLGIFFLFTFGFALFFCFSKLFGQLAEFARNILESKDAIIAKARELFSLSEDLFAELFRGEDELAEQIRARFFAFLETSAGNIISAVTAKITLFLGKVFSAVPKILFFLAAMLLSCIYFCLDMPDITNFFKKKLAKPPFCALKKLKRASFSALGQYMRAMLVIFFMTATELFTGFLFIGVRYALLLAVVTAFVDMLPVFGSGTVLVPYAIYSFAVGDLRRGVGLAVLYGAVTLVRQVSEPRIMGKSLGVHPLISLAAVYAGFHLFGVWGMVFLPIAVVAAKNIIYGVKM